MQIFKASSMRLDGIFPPDLPAIMVLQYRFMPNSAISSAHHPLLGDLCLWLSAPLQDSSSLSLLEWDWNIEMLMVLAEELSLQMLTIMYRAKSPPEPYNIVFWLAQRSMRPSIILFYTTSFKTFLYRDPTAQMHNFVCK
ncbi:hypothetical protein D5086_003534 [Populus alba]|uniref:Uncharacterized protein n=1 Tax=Populus alba TaxID=43335 RepID=A0ACC4D5G2_POPAL